MARWLGLVLFGLFALTPPTFADSTSDNPIVFVTMVPNPRDFGTTAATFGNHLSSPDSAFRGGDLWIRYPNGTLKNLTSAAGYGNAGFQGAQSIAVRDPSPHWDGAKVIFSMLVGAPTQQYQLTNFKWQLYEITNLAQSETPVITKVAQQPSSYHNVSPTYASDDSIIFASDKPRDDSVASTYPQFDEYESAPTNTGLWKLNPSNGSLELLDHAPSGDFNPIVDSFGRIIFTRWDHLQRDQQNVGVSFGAFNFSSETSTESIGSAPEVFPEPRSTNDPNYRSTVNLFTINQFFPWMMSQDGTGLETLNHIGRQEVGVYSERSFNDDPNVQEFYGQYATGQNTNDFNIFLHIKEDPGSPGTYLGVNCQEFATHAAGQIISIHGAPSVNPDAMTVQYLTHPDTAGATATPSGNHSGLYRDPLPLSNGKLLAAHTVETREDTNIGTSTAPLSRYAFRIKVLQSSGSHLTAGAALTTGISKSVTFWDPDKSLSYNGELWELMPVELKARVRPAATAHGIPAVEQSILDELGVQESELKEYLTANNLALIISRNLTTRDKNDRQQPTNLRVTGSSTESIPKGGKIYDISHLQIFQGDLIRGYTSRTNGRRVLAQPMHSVESGINIPLDGAPTGSVEIAEDGSMAAFVPARRALSWQMVEDGGDAVVRERYWLTFQPGEIRVCASCHGVNTADHLGKSEPTNPPRALSRLLAHWKDLPMTGPGGEYSLEVTGIPKLIAGGKFRVSAGARSTSETLAIKARIKKVSCERTVALSTGSKERTLTGKFPKQMSTRVQFILTQGDSSETLATKSVKVRSKGTSRRKPLSSAAACKALMKSLK